MKWIRVLLGALGALVVLLVAGGWLLNPRYEVRRAVEVAVPPAKVYALVADPRAWKRWSAWHRRDPFMATEYQGPDSGAGASWSWRSASEGSGRMRFTAAEPAQRLAYELQIADMGAPSHGEFSFQALGAGRTRVQWALRGDAGANPLMRWFGLLSDRLVGPDFQAGLDQLKQLAETH